MQQSIARKKPKLKDSENDNSPEENKSFNFEPFRKKRIAKDCEESQDSVTYNNLEQFKARSKTINQTEISEDTVGFEGAKNKSTPRKPKVSNQESLTLATQNAIAQAKMPKKKNEEVSRILAMPSLRERFEVMSRITSPATMMMHSKYKSLCNQFSEVDQMILFLNGRQNLSDAKKPKFELGMLKQMVSVWPECYVLSWATNEKKKQLDQWDLVVSQKLNQKLLEERKEQFREKMFGYLQSHGDYIAEGELPARPDENRVKENDAYVKDLQQVKSVVQEVLQNLAKMNDKSIEVINYSKMKNIKPDSKMIVSSKLLEMVRRKEERLKSNQLIEKVSYEKLYSTASSLNFYYGQRQVSNMFLANVVEYLAKSNKKTILSNKDIFSIIKQLCELVPEWLKILETANGSILRMDKSKDFAEVVSRIESETLI